MFVWAWISALEMSRLRPSGHGQPQTCWEKKHPADCANRRRKSDIGVRGCEFFNTPLRLCCRLAIKVHKLLTHDVCPAQTPAKNSLSVPLCLDVISDFLYLILPFPVPCLPMLPTEYPSFSPTTPLSFPCRFHIPG